MDLKLLHEALENNNNLSIINTNIQNIKAQKNDILQQLGLQKNNLKDYNKRLKDYRYVDNISDLNYGSNIRWINLKKIDNINITNGAILCDIKIIQHGIGLCLKTYNNKFICITMNDNLIFQKISDQESILLKAINYLNK